MREYLDEARRRILLENGYSLVTADTMAENIIRGRSIDWMIIDDDVEGYDGEVYQTLYHKDIITSPEPEYEDVHINEDEAFELLVSRIEASPRFSDNPAYIERLEQELTYFQKKQNIIFLLRTSDVIQKFKENGVVWGVGRGSSCASLVCYLLEINDIDPVKYDIPFIELTKIDDNDY